MADPANSELFLELKHEPTAGLKAFEVSLACLMLEHP